MHCECVLLTWHRPQSYVFQWECLSRAACYDLRQLKVPSLHPHGGIHII